MLSYKKKEELKKTIYILYCAILALAVSACSKEEQGDSNGLPYITFGVSGINIDTKALITNDDLTSNSHPIVYVYGVINNTTNVFDETETEIYKESNSNNWNTKSILRKFFSPISNSTSWNNSSITYLN